MGAHMKKNNVMHQQVIVGVMGLLRGHQFRQDQPQQGTAEGPHEEEKGNEHGEDQVRGALQERQEQVVLPEAEVLETSILKTVILTLVHILSVCLVASIHTRTYSRKKK